MIEEIKQNVQTIVEEWIESDYLKSGNVFVIGCSTSEVGGKHIGTSGSEEIAEVLFNAMNELKERTGVQLAYQCCEHLNRAICLERTTSRKLGLEEVSVVPVKAAGGSMATFAYNHFEDPVMVEGIKGDAGIDIGETMIGMQLRHVAVPLRFNQRYIGKARVNGARVRGKLIGGARAHYEDTRLNNSCK